MVEFLYHDPAFKRRCLNLTKDENDAQDLLQDVALRLLDAGDILSKPLTEIKAYAYVMIRNRFLDRENVRTKYRHIEIKIDPAVLPTVETDMQTSVELNQITKKIAQLNPAHKKALLLVSSGKEYKEVSEEMQVPLGTLLSDVRAARQFLTGERAEPRKVKEPRTKRKRVCRVWTIKEDKLLEQFAHLGAKKISETILNRTVSSIFIRAQKLDICLSVKGWDKSEDEIIISNYMKDGITINDLKKLLHHRTAKAIRHRIAFLGLKKVKAKSWTNEEKEKLKRIYRKTSAEELERIFERKRKAIAIAYMRLNDPLLKLLKRKNIRKAK